jgi:hypothetical protein
MYETLQGFSQPGNNLPNQMELVGWQVSSSDDTAR